MLIAVNRSIERNRRRLVILFGAFALACALMLAHGTAGSMHMGMSENGAMSFETALEVCLAVTETAAVGLAALALLRSLNLARPMFRAPGLLVVLLPNRATPVPVGARAGPDLLQVFRW